MQYINRQNFPQKKEFVQHLVMNLFLNNFREICLILFYGQNFVLFYALDNILSANLQFIIKFNCDFPLKNEKLNFKKENSVNILAILEIISLMQVL